MILYNIRNNNTRPFHRQREYLYVLTFTHNISLCINHVISNRIHILYTYNLYHTSIRACSFILY